MTFIFYHSDESAQHIDLAFLNFSCRFYIKLTETISDSIVLRSALSVYDLIFDITNDFLEVLIVEILEQLRGLLHSSAMLPIVKSGDVQLLRLTEEDCPMSFCPCLVRSCLKALQLGRGICFSARNALASGLSQSLQSWLLSCRYRVTLRQASLGITPPGNPLVF